MKALEALVITPPPPYIASSANISCVPRRAAKAAAADDDADNDDDDVQKIAVLGRMILMEAFVRVCARDSTHLHDDCTTTAEEWYTTVEQVRSRIGGEIEIPAHLFRVSEFRSAILPPPFGVSCTLESW